MAAAIRTTALLMAQPMPMDRSVSPNSYFSCRRMTGFILQVPLPALDDLRVQNRLWGMTTAPNTFMITGMEPAGKDGFTQPVSASPQLTCTRQISAMNERPISDTKPMMIFSIFL